MNQLLLYINSMPPSEQVEFASACGTSVGYLRKACSKGQKIGADICVSIERKSTGKVTRKDLRPNDWQDIWPELVGS